jgi:hypothetical protein
MYRVAAGKRACVYVRNHARIPLKVALLDAGSDGAVQWLGDEMIDPDQYHVFWAQSTVGKAYKMLLPSGADLARDRLVAIGRSSPRYELDYLRVRQTFAGVVQRLADKDDPVDDGADRTFGEGEQAAATERWTAVQVVVEIK